MNFLQLAQRVRQEAGISGDGPTSVVNQTGEMKRVVDWTAEAWRKVQEYRTDWRWMRATATTTTVSGTNNYSPTGSSPNFGLTRWGRWIITSFYITDSSGQNRELVYMPYADFRRRFIVLAPSTAMPTHVTEAPNGNIILGPTPDGAYPLVGDYYKNIQELTQDTDTPEMPAAYHAAIVYRALMMYARYEAAAEIYQDALNNFDEEMARLERDQLEQPQVYTQTLVE
jgi:hypothetical protein